MDVFELRDTVIRDYRDYVTSFMALRDPRIVERVEAALYGIERGDVDYILGTFPIVNCKDRERYGEERTRRLILERYDALAEAARTGVAYQTVLDPPPADPAVAHPESTRPDWALPPAKSRG